MLHKFCHPFVIGMGLFLGSLTLADEPSYRIPLKPDPPFSIDGELSDWQEAPNEFILSDVKHVTYEPRSWKGAGDLSAKVKIAWRDGVLYLGVEVTDDIIAQEKRGEAMYLGDHIEIFLDLSPLSEPQRSYLGAGQWQFGLSPGNFKTTGDPAVDIKPEAICFVPKGVGGEEAIQVAAKRTQAGYTLEASIPFSLMNWKTAREGMELKAEVAISDCDSVEPKQEKMMTLSTEKWVLGRKRLIPMALANATGKGHQLNTRTQEKRSAPTGPIPTIEPDQIHKQNYTLKQPNPTTVEISIQGEQFAIESKFSSPDGKWNQGSSRFYEHSRRIERKDEAIIVFDTFKNTSEEDVPVMQLHSWAAGGEIQEVWIRGLRVSAGSYHVPANPTTYAQTEKAGIGLVALNDEFRVHVVNAYLKKRAELADKSFVLKVKGTYTAEWAIVPVAAPAPSSRDGGIRTGFWNFINATRRLMDVNFTLPYQFAFIDCRRGCTDEHISSFVRNKDAHFVSPMMLTKMDRSTSFLEKGDHATYTKWFEQFRRVIPDVIVAPYFHCFLDPTEANVERFKSDRTLNSDGVQGDYGGKHSYLKEFLPTLSNGIGREFSKVVDKYFELGASGIYWDEFEGSSSEYHYPDPVNASGWDGVSGDIHPTTLKLLRKKSSVPLVSQDYCVRLAKRIMTKCPLIANGMPVTRTVAALKIQRFNETGQITHCAKTLLYSPIALGDHLTERSELDAYQLMLAALDFGCVYNWYPAHVVATHKTLASYMFPITPMELHEGYIIGKERIVTKKSGLYGWGDASEHEVHVFNEKGEEALDFKAPRITKDGKTFTELRIAEEWSAAIIRKSEIVPDKEAAWPTTRARAQLLPPIRTSTSPARRGLRPPPLPLLTTPAALLKNL